jgi:hypothetical protein
MSTLWLATLGCALQNEGSVKIQFKCLVPIYVFPEMKLRGLLISKTELQYNVLSPNFRLSVSDLYIPRTGQPILLQSKRDRSWEYINRSQIHEYRNWERGRAI